MSRIREERKYATDFARNLDKWMREEDLTLNETAERFDVSLRTIQNWLAEIRTPSFALYQRVRKATNDRV